MFKKISRHKLIIFLLILVIISVLFFLIVFINKQYNSQNNPSGLKGYNSLIESLNQLKSTDDLTKIGNYTAFKENLISISDPKLTDKEKYDLLLSNKLRLELIYEDTNDHSFYIFSEELDKFAKSNFSDLYKENSFQLTCSDPQCATQAKEILEVINIINKSSLSQEIKDSEIQQLKTLAFINKDESEIQINRLYISAKGIKDNQNYKDAGINNQVYNKIIEFLIKNYPEEIKKVSNVKNLDNLKVK